MVAHQLAGFVERSRYYGVWILTEGASILTGLGFTIKFGLATAIVSIQERPPVPFQDRRAAYQAVIEDLAKALLQTAQNPQLITEAPELLG